MNKTARIAVKTIISAIAVPAVLNAFILRMAEINDTKDFEKDIRTRESYFDWRHARVRYIEAGSGIPLLLIHNMEVGGSLYEWQEVIHSLSEHFHVYAIDLPGFGYSEKSLMTYSVYFYISLVNEFIRKIIGEKTCVAASGASSAIAVFAAEMEPEYISRTLLISPEGILEKNMPTNRDVWCKWLLSAPVIGTSIHNILSSKILLKRQLENQLKRRELVVRKMVRRMYFAAHTGGIKAKSSTASLMTRFLNVAIEHKLCKPAVPTHIIWCKGCTAGLDSMFNIVRKSQSLSVSVFKSANISPQLEIPEKFVRCCVNFFNK